LSKLLFKKVTFSVKKKDCEIYEPAEHVRMVEIELGSPNPFHWNECLSDSVEVGRIPAYESVRPPDIQIGGKCGQIVALVLHLKKLNINI
jgi:hypothetical protein